MRDVLKLHEVFARLRVSPDCCRARENAELRRGVQRIDFQRVLEGVDRLRKLL